MTRVLLFVLCLIATGASAQDDLDPILPTETAIEYGLAGQDPPALARYLLARGAIAAVISPTGRDVALLLDTTGSRELWVVPAAGGAPRQLTFRGGVRFFRWLPDGSGLFYGADDDGNQLEAYFEITVDGTRERIVVPSTADGYRAFGDFTPDGRRFTFASTERNGVDFDLYVGDRTTGAVELVYEGNREFVARSWSPDGTRFLVTEGVGEDSVNLHLFDTRSGELTTLFAPAERATFAIGIDGNGEFEWSADGSSVYYATNHEREFQAVVQHDIADNTLERIGAADGHDLMDVRMVADRWLAWTVNEDGFDRALIHDLRTGDEFEIEGLPTGVYGLSAAKDAPLLGIDSVGPSNPGDVFVFDVESRTLTRAFASNRAGLRDEDFVVPTSVWCTARDGLEIQGLLYLPEGIDDPPVVFDVHGGPTGQSRVEYNAVAQYFVSQGIAVFEPNVRGSTGFGRSYYQADDRRLRLDSVRDLADQLACLQERDLVDTSRAAVRGGSYGGYMVNAVLAAYPDAFAAGVSLFGVGNWVTALEIASPDVKASDLVEYGDVEDPQWRAFYEEISPVRIADRIRVPVLYMHGANDPVVDKGESEQMVRALRANDVPTEYVLFPDEGHGWRKTKNRLFGYPYEVDFLKRHLGIE